MPPSSPPRPPKPPFRLPPPIRPGICFIIFFIWSNCFTRRLTSLTSTPAPFAMRCFLEGYIRFGLALLLCHGKDDGFHPVHGFFTFIHIHTGELVPIPASWRGYCPYRPSFFICASGSGNHYNQILPCAASGSVPWPLSSSTSQLCLFQSGTGYHPFPGFWKPYGPG